MKNDPEVGDAKNQNTDAKNAFAGLFAFVAEQQYGSHQALGNAYGD